MNTLKTLVDWLQKAFLSVNLLNPFTNRFILLLLLLFIINACVNKIEYVQPELSSRSSDIIKQEGYQFKDLNKNGKLDKYEDWRLTIDERVADLLEKMTLEEKVGFMMISTINMGGPPVERGAGGFGRNREVTSDLAEEDVINETNFFTRQPLPVPTLSVSATTKGIMERHLRHFILRANTKPQLLRNGQTMYRK